MAVSVARASTRHEVGLINDTHCQLPILWQRFGWSQLSAIWQHRWD